MTHVNEHIPSHCRELTRFQKVDSTSDPCFPAHGPLILHHDSTERFPCTFEGTFQWPPRNPQQWSKSSGIKGKDYWPFKPHSFLSSNLKYNSSCINVIYSRSSISIYSSLFLWEHKLKIGKCSKQLSFGLELSICVTPLNHQGPADELIESVFPGNATGQRVQDPHPRNLSLWQSEHLEISTPSERFQ